MLKKRGNIITPTLSSVLGAVGNLRFKIGLVLDVEGVKQVLKRGKYPNPNRRKSSRF
jgi:hypothetical protein